MRTQDELKWEIERLKAAQGSYRLTLTDFHGTVQQEVFVRCGQSWDQTFAFPREIVLGRILLEWKPDPDA